MKIEATVKEIRALVQLAELDAEVQELSPATHRSRGEKSRKEVGAALLERYQALLDAGRCPAIVAIERGSCSRCHLRLPTMVESQARRSPAVHTCPHCRRMLYAPELLTAEDVRGEVPPQKERRPRATRASPGERS